MSRSTPLILILGMNLSFLPSIVQLAAASAPPQRSEPARDA